jgi:predicted N-formylglutamate amidohydrolase
LSGRPGGPAGPAIVVTCEHGGHRVPAAYETLFEGAGAREALASHRGWDAGALPLARRLARHLDAELHVSTVTRLLVDLNRSAHNSRVLSAWTRALPAGERRVLLRRHHAPHRSAVDASVAAALAGAGRVLHLGVHTFTPALDGNVRRADVALLYDPVRGAERALCAAWAGALAAALPGLAVRRNQPYHGASDGLTTWLRGRHGEAYLGIELEVNQRLMGASNRFPDRIADTVADGLGVALEAVEAS